LDEDLENVMSQLEEFALGPEDAGAGGLGVSRIVGDGSGSASRAARNVWW
jgi:hypothetical protein